MNLESAKVCIGHAVETNHAGHKMIKSRGWHGPYILKQVTKGGLCILEGYEEFRVPPSQIRYYDWFDSTINIPIDSGICQLEMIHDTGNPLADLVLKVQDETVLQILLKDPTEDFYKNLFAEWFPGREIELHRGINLQDFSPVWSIHRFNNPFRDIICIVPSLNTLEEANYFHGNAVRSDLLDHVRSTLTSHFNESV